MHPVPAAKDALKAILAASPTFDPPFTIEDGRPTELEDFKKDAFWFEATVISRDAWASLGAGRRRITFTLNFVITARRHGDHERTTEDVLWEYVEGFMALVKANPSLIETVQKTGDVTGRQENGPFGTKQWRAAFIGSLTCDSKAY